MPVMDCHTFGVPMSEYVLVVDDEPLIRWFAARVLREEGFEVHEANEYSSCNRSRHCGPSSR
jgi:CheY-like chemotaxis protein